MPDQLKPYPLATQAIRADDVERLKRVFSSHPDIKELAVPAFGTWLHYAASTGAIAVFEYLLSLGMDLNAKNRDGRTPLNQAAAGNRRELVQMMLGRGASIDVSDPAANPLFGCIAGSAMDGHPVHGSGNPPSDRLEIARLLLDASLDPSVRYDSDTMIRMDAVAFAWMFGRRDIARLIADRLAHGDAGKIEALLLGANQIAELNTEPVPEGEDCRPS